MNASQKAAAQKRKQEIQARKEKKKGIAESSTTTTGSSSTTDQMTVKQAATMSERAIFDERDTEADRLAYKWGPRIGPIIAREGGSVSGIRKVTRLDLQASIEDQSLGDSDADISRAYRALRKAEDYEGLNAAHLLAMLHKQRDSDCPIELTTFEKNRLTAIAEHYHSLYPDLLTFSDSKVDIVGTSEPNFTFPYLKDEKILPPTRNGMYSVWAKHINRTIRPMLAQNEFIGAMSVYKCLSVSSAVLPSMTHEAVLDLRQFTEEGAEGFVQALKDYEQKFHTPFRFLDETPKEDPGIQSLLLRKRIFGTLTGRDLTLRELSGLMTPTMRSDMERHMGWDALSESLEDVE